MLKRCFALMACALLPLCVNGQTTNLPIITLQPKSLFVEPGKRAVLSVTATNPYATLLSASAGSSPATTNIIATGTNSGTLAIDYDFYTAPDDLRVYYDGVLIFDSGLASGPGRFVIDYGPGSSTDVIIVMNEGGGPNPGTLWQYTVAIPSELDYQWRKDGTPIPAATQSSYSITNVHRIDAGTYSVAIGNPGGSVTSQDAFLSVAPAPRLSVALTSTNTVLLCWPMPFPGFVLQQNSGLDSTNWVAVTNTPSVVGDQNQVILPMPDRQFYQLQFP